MNDTGVVAGVEQHQQRVVDDRLAALVDLVHRVAVQPHAEARARRARSTSSSVISTPDGSNHARSFTSGAADRPALEELPAPQHRMLLADVDQRAA